MNLQPVEIKAFVPARDWAASQRFDQALGFTMPWSDNDLACVHLGHTSLLLQRFHVADHSSTFAMHLLAENADDWQQHVSGLDLHGRFGVRVGPLKDQPWAMREFALHDPTGVPWLVAHNLPRPAG